MAQKRDFATRVVAARRDRGFDAATDLVRTGEGKQLMDAIRAEATERRVALVRQLEMADEFIGLLDREAR